MASKVYCRLQVMVVAIRACTGEPPAPHDESAWLGSRPGLHMDMESWTMVRLRPCGSGGVISRIKSYALIVAMSMCGMSWHLGG